MASCSRRAFSNSGENHSAGEIVNSNGFTTNHIENRWSLVKRWVCKRMGGRLPLHSNREKWTRLLNEFHWRSWRMATAWTGAIRGMCR